MGGRVGHACAAHGSWEAVQLDRELLKAEVHPDVRENIRLQADGETRLLLANLKACLLSSLLLRVHIFMHLSTSGTSDAFRRGSKSARLWADGVFLLLASHSSAGTLLQPCPCHHPP